MPDTLRPKLQGEQGLQCKESEASSLLNESLTLHDDEAGSYAGVGVSLSVDDNVDGCRLK